MDLTKFTKENNKIPEEKKSIINTTQIKAEKHNENITFNIKTKEALSKNQKYLFFSPTTAKIVNNKEETEEFFEESINENVEGLMIKNLNASYKPGLRTAVMAKLKETKEDIDVIIIAAEHGKGKRAGYYSSFLVAVKNNVNTDEENNYLTIGKVSSGIKEIGEEGASMTNLTNLLKPLKLKEEKNLTYFEPKIIIQIRYQEIQKSSIYNSGFALRFPRIISLREDKPIDEINSISDIKKFA